MKLKFKSEVRQMNIRIKVFYYNSVEDSQMWNGKYDHFKTVRASSEDKAIEIFKKRFPELIPAFACKW